MKTFNERFNCKINDNLFNIFKDRCIVAVFEVLDKKIVNKQIETDYLKQIGEGSSYYEITVSYGLGMDFLTEKSIKGKDTIIGKDLISCINENKFLYKMEIIINLKSLEDKDKLKLINEIKNIINETRLPILLLHNKKEAYFLPSNCKELDKQVDNTFNWLDTYPSVKNEYIKAIKQLNLDPKESLNNLRKSLEDLIKIITKTNSTKTDKIKSALSKYLSDKGITSEIINVYNCIFSHLDDYQNNYVKHTNQKLPEHIFNKNETNFLLYQYTNFIQFILLLEK